MVFAFIFAAVSPVFAQQYQVIYPNGKVAISEKPLPLPVYESQKNILLIEGEFFPKNNPAQNLRKVWQTGFVNAESGNIVSARHGLVETAMSILESNNLDYQIDNQGVIRGIEYDYKFYASVLAATRDAALKKYNLSVISMGAMGTDIDVVVFKSKEKIPVKALQISNTASLVGETVYFSGVTRSSSHFHEEDGEEVYITFQNIKFNIESTILSVFASVEHSSVGKMYLLSRPVKGGFSGGPILNKTGKVIGMGVATDEIFSYAISAQDIISLLNNR